MKVIREVKLKVVNIKNIELKEEIDKITFECANPKCGCTNIVLNTAYINGYGELACPMCFNHDLKVIFLNYKRVEKER